MSNFHYATSSGLESTGSLLLSLPSESSDVQMETTPPTSPTPSEGKMCTPRDILDACRRLGQVSLSDIQLGLDTAPIRPPKQRHHREPSECVASDEAGYDADGDGDEDGDEGACVSAGTTKTMTSTTKPTRRPTFLRIDTQQHRRVASMLATRRPSPTSSSFGDLDIPRRPRARLPSIRLKPTAPGVKTESYELRRRAKAEPVGLGIGFPENHPLRGRAFTLPVFATTVSPVDDGLRVEVRERGSEWLPSRSPPGSKRSVTTMEKADVRAPSPFRLVLRPTFLEVSPSPIECLAGPSAGTSFRCDTARDRLEIERQRFHALPSHQDPGLPKMHLSESEVEDMFPHTGRGKP